MPSLKDLRNRIAATKATQKITKAMQMVAVSKLRRAQAAAEAARPYAERMETVLRNIAVSVTGLDSAPVLLRGTGSDRVHLLLVCTAERGLCGPFNSAIVRLVREHATKLLAEGKEIKIFCVGRKGHEQLRRQYERNIIEHVELRSLRGRPVVLNFWASWCIPCAHEAPRLVAAAKEHEGRVLFLGLDVKDFSSDARKFLRRFRVNYVSVRDGGSGTYDAYGLTGLPESYFLDASGRIVAHKIGEISRAELEDGIAQALGAGP